MTYQQFLKRSIAIHEEAILRVDDRHPYPRAYVQHLRGTIAGMRTALRMAEFNKIDGVLATEKKE